MYQPPKQGGCFFLQWLSALKSHKSFVVNRVSGLFPDYRGSPQNIYVLWGGKCRCVITKAMLAGILHSGFLLVVFSQPEKKKPVDFCKVVETVAL